MFRFYLQLIKTPQTGLLVFTAFAGYQSAVNAGAEPVALFDLILAFFGMLLVVCGTTALNMVFDHDIDAVMERTKMRPIPRGVITTRQASILSWFSILVGSSINLKISIVYCVVVLLGFLFDFIVYTIWLKRRSPWSIVFGGLSGGMPVLAGRVLATGSIDTIGILLATAILLWIPTHILTLAMNHDKDYKLAGVPTFPNKLGFTTTRYIIAVSNLLAALILIFVGYQLEISNIGMQILRVGSLGLFILSIRLISNPSEERNFTLFKYASLFMAGVMLIFIL